MIPDIDEKTLIYTTDWMTWRLCVEAGYDSVQFEGLLELWPSERGDPSYAHVSSWEWVYDDGVDVTKFKGVSLGKLFVRNISWFYHASARQFYALDRACKRWRPREILLIGLRAELNFVGEEAIRYLVADVANRHGISVIENLDQPAGDDAELHDRNDGYAIPSRGNASKSFLRNAIGEVFDAACRVRNFFGGVTRRVLIVSNWSSVRGIVNEAHSSEFVRPAVVIGHLPKRPMALLRWFVHGVTMIGHPYVRLNKRDHAALGRIRDRIRDLWAEPVSGIELTLREFIGEQALESQWLELYALETKRWHKLFSRHHPERAMVGDATNWLCRLIAEVAQDRNVPVDELLNGLFVTSQRYDARTGDKYCRPVVDRLLSWGPQNEDWLAVTGSPIDLELTGYPALDALRENSFSSVSDSESDVKALVLPLYVDCDDVCGLWANIFSHLVSMVHQLRQIGCDQIRVKVHPGPFNATYYKNLFSHYDLSVDLISSGSLEPHIEWADFIVGPINSGAFVEAIASGTTYYPMRCEPTLIDDRLLGPIKCYDDPESVAAAINRGERPNNKEAGNYLASLDLISSAGRTTWKVLNKTGAPSPSSEYEVETLEVTS
jgi:hypothetical protein